jgi:hypothetical protein
MKYLNRKIFIWLIILLSVGFYLLYLLCFPITEKTILNYLKPITTVVTFDAIILLLFEKWIWKCKFLHSWLVPFPNLNGTWKGYIKSNWIDPVTNKKPDPIPVILTIRQSFLHISCVMRTKEMESRNFISGFNIDENNQILRLVYSYISVPEQSIRDRSPQHKGTMSFDIIKDNGQIILIGNYWTERQTTGKVELTFWKQERLEKYPDELGEHPVSEIRKSEE